MIISIYIIKVGLHFGKDAVLVLMDASLSSQCAEEIKEIAEATPGVGGVHNIRLRKSSPVTFGEMHIEVQLGLPSERAHEISSEVEQRVQSRFKGIESITIHVGISHKGTSKLPFPYLKTKD